MRTSGRPAWSNVWRLARTVLRLLGQGMRVGWNAVQWLRAWGKRWYQARRLAALPVPAAAGWSVYFSPRGGCAAAVTAALAQAQHEVLLQGYGFTSQPVAEALIAARRRGVNVRCLIDGDQRLAKACKAAVCQAAGVEVCYDAKHLIAHNKVLVIDRQLVLTGSYNWTAAAETSNAENLLLVNDAGLAAAYAANWLAHRAHACP